MAVKPKIAFYWCSSCGGCEESILDLAGDILAVAERADVVFWPVAVDAKYKDLAGIGDGEITVTLINGAVRMDEQESMARLLRKKSKILIAQGSCAHLGGVVGLANFFDRKECLKRSYQEVPTVENAERVLPQTQVSEPGTPLVLSGFHDTVKALDQVVAVDYYIPGCPSTPELIREAIMAVLEKRLPESPAVLADGKALCNTCPLKDTKPEKIYIKKFKRLYEIDWDSSRCFLGQDIICLGPVTRGGCEARCIRANMPCRGCFGPVDAVTDQGAKASSFLASLIDATAEEEIREIAASIPDPAGLFYRYGLASSILRGKVRN